MGPTIILDKSAIQSFSESEIGILSKFYTFNIPYNLYYEILTDLSKKHKDKNYETHVIHLANKLPGNFKINVHYRILIINELLGIAVPFTYRTLVPGEKIITNEEGKRGAFIKQSMEESAIERWRVGDFTKEEIERATVERKKIGEVNIGQIIASSGQLLKKHNIKLDENNLIGFIDKTQENLHSLSPLEIYEQLEILMDLLKVDSETQFKVKERWYSLKDFNFEKFAPYTSYFQKLMFTFSFGTASRIFGTRSSNLIDMEYILYLPFCFVFCTGDNFQYKIAQMVRSGSQYILNREELKNDLKLISEHNKGKENIRDYTLPNNSLTKKIIDDYMALDKTIIDDNLDSITLESEVSIFSPCPCGSGKKLKDCYYDKIMGNEESA